MCLRMDILYYTEKFQHYLLISWQVKLLLDFFQLLVQLQEILYIYIYIHLKSYIVSNTLKTIFWSKFEALLACNHKIYTLERIFLIHHSYNRMGIIYLTIFHFGKNLFHLSYVWASPDRNRPYGEIYRFWDFNNYRWYMKYR